MKKIFISKHVTELLQSSFSMPACLTSELHSPSRRWKSASAEHWEHKKEDGNYFCFCYHSKTWFRYLQLHRSKKNIFNFHGAETITFCHGMTIFLFNIITVTLCTFGFWDWPTKINSFTKLVYVYLAKTAMQSLIIALVYRRYCSFFSVINKGTYMSLFGCF